MKLAIVNGGSRGIGRSAAFHVARSGAAVILTCNRDAAPTDGDVQNQATRSNQDGIGVLVNNAWHNAHGGFQI